jgi:crotonobetainyl-CoA:carnitine CoA-transferase CaiB-like acyl-CoA transferase
MVSMPPLTGVTVLEWSTTLAGAYTGRLLADAGAHVIRVGGAPGLGRGRELDAYLLDGKSVVGASLEMLPALVAEYAADIAVVDLPDAPDGDLIRALSGVAVAYLTPWGLDGPWAGTGRPWTEFTLQAESGSLSIRGLQTSYPIMTGSSECLWVAGAMAAGAVIAGLLGGPADQVVDVSLLEVTAYCTNLFEDAATAVAGTPRAGFRRRARLTPGVEPARDGWVGFNLASMQNHQDFLVLIERPDWLADEVMSTFLGRYTRSEEWTEATRAWTRRHTVAEIVELAGQFRIPCAPVHNGRTLLEDPQVVHRDFFEPHPGGFMVPRPPMFFDGERPDRRAVGHITPSPPRRGEWRGTLEGLRVLELGNWWVCPYVGSVLGSYGADVIKIESTRRIDGSRTMGGVPSTRDHWWECGNFYLAVNFNKRNISLDITQPEGKQLLVRLIETADVLIENYAPRVLESVGLDWDAVHAINPRLVMVRMPAFGLTGPRRSMVGFAQTVEQYSGLCWRTGYPGGDPTNPSGPGDPMGGANALFALLAAVWQSKATSTGMLVEAPLAEAAMIMSAEQVIAWTSRGALLDRTGNRSAQTSVQGIFAAPDSEHWVAISIADEPQWEALIDVTGFTDWRAAHLATAEARREHADQIEQRLAAWMATRQAREVVERLIAAKIPAAVVTDARFVHEHEHLDARGAYEVADLPWAGKIALPTLPFRRPAKPGWLARRPPTLGEHNTEILGELGVSADEMRRLEERRVIGTRPDGR